MRTTATVAEPSRRLAALDGLRGLAIILVLVYHYTVRWTQPNDPANHFPAAEVFSGLPAVGQFGWAGVSLFFMISGFVIHMTLERSGSVVHFIGRRIARLWPPMLVGCTITSLVLLAIGPADWRPTWFEYGFSVLFIPPSHVAEAFGHPGVYGWVDGAYWTLFAEVRFYALAAVVWLFWPRRFLAIITGFAAVGLALYSIANSLSPFLGQVVHVFTFAKQAPFFALGALAYARYRGARGAWLVIGLVVCAALTFYVAGLSMTRIGLNAVALALVGWVVWFSARGMGALSRGLMPFVGRISYSLYLLHQMIGVSLLIALTKAGVPLAIAIPGVTGLMVLAAWGQYRIVEVRARNWLIGHMRAPESWVMARWPSLAYQDA